MEFLTLKFLQFESQTKCDLYHNSEFKNHRRDPWMIIIIEVDVIIHIFR